jgi:hypothetical protein
MRSIRPVSVLAVVASVLAAGPLWAADTVRLTGIKNAVAVKGDLRIEKGYVYYTEIITNRAKRTQASRVASIHIEKIKQLAQGDAAVAKKDYGKAANLYKSAYSRASKTAWLKLWVGRRLVAAYDKDKQFAKALPLYLDLLAKDSTNYIRSVQPQNAPSDKAVLKALVPKVEKALANASGAEHKQHLTRVKDWLNKGGPAPAAAAVNSVSATSNNRSKLASRLKKMTEAKQYADVLALVRNELEQPAAPLAALLYYQGVAQGATGKDMDALVSYMRVIVHFPAIRVYSQPSRVEAGKLFVKLKQKQRAKQLWTEGLHSAKRAKRASTIKQFQALLKGA